MRPCYLRFNGINSFSEEAEIDFSSLLSQGLFGIFGDTGSGKSTILDCITFALYGSVARAPSHSGAEIVNYRSEKGQVAFEFECFYGGKRKKFRVERTIRRKNAAQTLKVLDLTDDVTLADGVREGNALLEKIVGLSEEDFERCIALPQGEFAQFIKAQRGERLKLVTRLFGLEGYGEQLSRKASVRHSALLQELALLQSALSRYGDVDETSLSALEEENAHLKEEETDLRASLAKAREEEHEALRLLALRREKEEIGARLSRLKAEEGEIARLEEGLGRLPAAERAVSADAKRAQAERELQNAERLYGAAQFSLAKAEERAGACAQEREEALDEEIAALSRETALSEEGEKRERRRKELQETLERRRREYALEAERFKGFCYEEELAALEKALSLIKSGKAFFEEHAPSLFGGEYRKFADVLENLYRKYPETAEDILPLIAKYRAITGSTEDVNDLIAAYEGCEKERARLMQARVDLEKRNGAYAAHRERLQQLQGEGVRLKEELASLPQEEFRPAAELSALLGRKKAQKRALREERERAQAEKAQAEMAAAAALGRLQDRRENASSAHEELKNALVGFSSPQEAADLIAGMRGAEERVKKFREERAALLLRSKSLEEVPPITEEEAARARERSGELSAKLEECVKALALKKDALARASAALTEKRELLKEEKALKKRTDTAERLKKLLEGNKFMEYVAEETLMTVAQDASLRLLSLTSGKYFLRYDRGFYVGDNLNGGALRAVYTLSGGETFLVSLSLALALSAQICVRAARPIEFFFLDEGFGTLDSALVDTVMDSLEKLKGEHFSIGIISHVEELKHRIEKKLTVEKATDRHGSRIRT